MKAHALPGLARWLAGRAVRHRQRQTSTLPHGRIILPRLAHDCPAWQELAAMRQTYAATPGGSIASAAESFPLRQHHPTARQLRSATRQGRPATGQQLPAMWQQWVTAWQPQPATPEHRAAAGCGCSAMNLRLEPGDPGFLPYSPIDLHHPNPPNQTQDHG